MPWERDFPHCHTQARERDRCWKMVVPTQAMSRSFQDALDVSAGADRTDTEPDRMYSSDFQAPWIACRKDVLFAIGRRLRIMVSIVRYELHF